MKRKPRPDFKILEDIKSAGPSFVGLYMEDLLNRIAELDDKELKKLLVEEYYKNQKGFFDSKIGGTRTRINSLVRIIKADKVLFALQQISDNDSRIDDEAIKKAKSLILKIKNFDVKLPKLLDW